MKLGNIKATVTGFHNKATAFQKKRAMELFGKDGKESRIFTIYKIENNGNFCYSFNDEDIGNIYNVKCFKSLDGIMKRIRGHYTPFGYSVKLEWVAE